MIRFPPTRITLSEDEVEYHLHRVVYHYSLEAEFRRLHQRHDDNDDDDDSEHFDSFHASPHFRSPPGISDSDSGSGFDPAWSGKASKKGFSKESDGRSSGSWNVQHVDFGRVNTGCLFSDGTAIDTSIVPTSSITSQAPDSLSINACPAQHISQSDASIQQSFISDSSPTSISSDTRVSTTAQQPLQSVIQSPEVYSLSTALGRVSLSVPVDSSSSFSETPLNAISQIGKGSENQRIHCFGTMGSERGFCGEMETKEMAANAGPNTSERGDGNIIHPQRSNNIPVREPSSQAAPIASSAPNRKTPSPYPYPFSQNDNDTDSGKTTQPPHSQSRLSQTTTLNDQVTPNYPSSAASFLKTESSPGCEAQLTHSRPRRCPKGYRLDRCSPGDLAENHSPSLAEVLVEAEKLQDYFAAMVADLDREDDPNDFGFKELRRQPLGEADVGEKTEENI